MMMRFSRLVVLMMALLGWTATDANEGIEIVVHRGANALAPENTVASAMAALDHGATWVEVDVRASKDGVLFNLHDATLDRTTNGHGPLSEMLAADVKKLDAGRWFSKRFAGERVPTIAEMLDALKGKAGVFFDVKRGTPIEPLVKLVRQKGFGERSFFWFADEEMLRTFVRLAPEMKVKVNAKTIERLKYWQTVCQPAYVEIAPELITPQFSSYCHRNGIRVMAACQEDDTSQFDLVIEKQADLVNLDRPEVFYPLLKQATANRRIFIYSPSPEQGLHVATACTDGYHHLGQLCQSDYGAWGSEKRMHHPMLYHAADGSWRLVFQVNDHAPVVAVAYSRNLVDWRPQDYQRLSVAPCEQPVVREQADGFDIIFRSGSQLRRLTASADFRRFSVDKPYSPDGLEQLWQRDTVTVDGQPFVGQIFSISGSEAFTIERYFSDQEADRQLSAERMHDDSQRFAHLQQPLQATLRVDTLQQKAISPLLVGIFFEDISYAADGGLYAELVQNRDFEYSERDHRGWNSTTAWRSSQPIRIATEQPLSPQNAHYALVTTDTLTNTGWGGIAVTAGASYRFSLFARGRKTFDVQLVTPDGRIVAQERLKSRSDSWQRYETTLTANSEATADCQLRLIARGRRAAAIDMVSLFPHDTFRGHANGLRRDLAETIAALKPKFVRFPGGCLTHGQGIDNIYHWTHTIGPLHERQPDRNIWNYHQTRGLGFYEYFQFCEDIGAEPLPVLAAGVPCQNSRENADGIGGQQGGLPLDDMPAYIDELCHLIEWANGDASTNEWARKRAEAGHPEPFGLKMIGIGNEDLISTTFEERYEMICKALRERHPEIKICGTAGPFHAPSADYQEGWHFARSHASLFDYIDEHYYESTGWFLHHRDYYDHYDRLGPQVYLGEWAASTREKRPNVETALTEALYMTDLERNGDVVAMSSYAPMLCSERRHNWDPNMIYFTNTAVSTTPAYDVQRLFSASSGDRHLHSSLTVTDEQLNYRLGSSLVRDSSTGRTFLKLVNALPVPLLVAADGLQLPSLMKGEQLSGDITDRTAKAQPVTIKGQLQLPPYSLTVLEL